MEREREREREREKERKRVRERERKRERERESLLQVPKSSQNVPSLHKSFSGLHSSATSNTRDRQ